MNNKHLLLLGIAGFAGGFALVAGENSASALYWSRNHASFCQSSDEVDNTSFITVGAGGGAGASNMSLQADSAGVVVCPIPDNATIPKSTLKNIIVHVYDGNATVGQNVVVKGCASDPAGSAGGECGTAVTTSALAGGIGVLGAKLTGTAGLGKLTNSFYRGYVHVSLPDPDGTTSATSKVFGFYYADY